MDSCKIGSRIQDARIAKGITQAELSQILELSPKYISAIERGVKTPRLEILVAIANTLEIDANSLLVDVLNCAPVIRCSILWDQISKLSPTQQNKILSIVEILSNENI